MMDDKTRAHKFLTGLEGELTKLLPEPTQMRIHVAAPAEDGKGGESPSKIRENKFIYYALPIVTDYMQTIKGIGPNEARQSMLCEYHKKVRNSSGNPFRRAGHPFRKNSNLDVDKIMQSWTKEAKAPLNQAYPDFGVRPPFPHKIVFEAKYFCANSQAAANKVLVEGAYETMFYRGLPANSDRSEPGWDYDYGCLLAYDASEGGLLKEAWDGVMCKDTFWNGGNIFVMIIRGQGQALAPERCA
jgi:hypothetical protein